MAEAEPGREGDRLRCRAWVPYKSHTQSSADNARSLPLAPCLCPSKRAQTGPRIHRGCARGDQIAVPPLCHAQPFQSPHACTHRPVSTDLLPSNHLSTAAVCSHSSGSTTSTEPVAGLHPRGTAFRCSAVQARTSPPYPARLDAPATALSTRARTGGSSSKQSVDVTHGQVYVTLPRVCIPVQSLSLETTGLAGRGSVYSSCDEVGETAAMPCTVDRASAWLALRRCVL